MNLRQTKKAMLSAVGLLVAIGAGSAHAADLHRTHFSLVPNPKFFRCLARFPDDPSRAPSAEVFVVHGRLNDYLRMQLRNFKPGLAFDLFTVEKSTFKADGTPDPNAPNRGLAWYQSDVEISPNGAGVVELRTILLDQIFGFDPIVGLTPVNTFHLGFWFNDPNDVESCDATKPTTPFNGDHTAGPLAMISLPDAQTGLGPLCINPDFSTEPPHCNP